MKGLLKNNFYASRSNIRFFSWAMLVFGVFVVAMDNKIISLLMGYSIISMVGFTIAAIAGMRKEHASKWGKYKLTVPVRRRDIVKSYYLNQMIWLMAGVVLAGVCIGLSLWIHGTPFDRDVDIALLFTLGICVSLLTSAVFFPLSYVGGEDKNEAVLIISLVCGAGMFMGLVSLVNWIFGRNQTVEEVLMGIGIMLCCALAVFVLSFPVTVGIFKRKEF